MKEKGAAFAAPFCTGCRKGLLCGRNLGQIRIDLLQLLVSQRIAGIGLELLQRHGARHIDLRIADHLVNILVEDGLGLRVVQQRAEIGID